MKVLRKTDFVLQIGLPYSGDPPLVAESYAYTLFFIKIRFVRPRRRYENNRIFPVSAIDGNRFYTVINLFSRFRHASSEIPFTVPSSAIPTYALIVFRNVLDSIFFCIPAFILSHRTSLLPYYYKIVAIILQRFCFSLHFFVLTIRFALQINCVDSGHNKRISGSTDFSTSCKTFYIKLLDDHLVSRRKIGRFFSVEFFRFFDFTFLTILFSQCLEVLFNLISSLFQTALCIFH